MDPEYQKKLIGKHDELFLSRDELRRSELGHRNSMNDHTVLGSENKIKLPCLILNANKDCVTDHVRKNEVFALMDGFLSRFGIFEKLFVPDSQISPAGATAAVLGKEVGEMEALDLACGGQRPAKRLKRDVGVAALNE